MSLFENINPAASPARPPIASADQPEIQRAMKEEATARQRVELERRLASGEYDDVRTRVAFVLNQYPDTRNSDVELAIRYWNLYEAEDIDCDGISFDALRKVTKMTSIARARATIQNDFGLFLPNEAVTEARSELEQTARRRQRAVRRVTSPYVYVFADESGKNEKHYIIGSIWINDIDFQVESIRETLKTWRKSLDWQSDFHFSAATRERAAAYIEFVRQAMSASQYMGFKAIVLRREDIRRPTEEAIFSLYYRLIVDGLSHEVDSGRCELPRSLVVCKDADEGADKIHLLTLRDNLRVECPKQFDHQIYIAGVNSVPSSVTLMQLADVFTGSINRVLNKQAGASHGFKDDMARSVLQLLGLSAQDLERDVHRDFASVLRI
jgi:hypothetical protein